MGDSRTRAEDRAFDEEMEAAEERQRQMHAGTPAPSLSRVLSDTELDSKLGQQAYDEQRQPEEPVDDGPEMVVHCGPVKVHDSGAVEVFDLLMAQRDAKEVWEALTVLIREEVIK